MARSGARVGFDEVASALGDHVDRARAMLRAKDLRVTAARLAVLGALAEFADNGHLTATALHDRLARDGVGLDRVTLYRTVSTLAERRLVHQLTVSEQATTYGLADMPHHHAHCVRCGTVADVPAPELTKAVATARRASGFVLDDSASLTVEGLCPGCQRLRARSG